MISFDEALTRVLDCSRPLRSERVPLSEAQGRVLAEAVSAKIEAPRSDVSAMDGYAVRNSDLCGPSTGLGVVGESLPGAGFEQTVRAGECVRIFTGGPVPAGADRIVIQEVVRRTGEMAFIEADSGTAQYIRRRGSDFSVGDVLLPIGRRLDYRAMTAAAAGDNDTVIVWARPRVLLLNTGDELAAPGSAAGHPAAIPDSLGVGIAALAEHCGAEVIGHLRLRDDLELMKRKAAEVVARADVVVVTGGASVGERDFAKQMFADLPLELVFSKVAMKPGKPVWFGRAGTALVMGLPGNPTSAMVTARLLLAPLTAGLAGEDGRHVVGWRRVSLAAGLAPTEARETFVRAKWQGSAAEPLANQDSGAQSTLAAADLLLRRPAHSAAIEAGEEVEALNF